MPFRPVPRLDPRAASWRRSSYRVPARAAGVVAAPRVRRARPCRAPRRRAGDAAAGAEAHGRAGARPRVARPRRRRAYARGKTATRVRRAASASASVSAAVHAAVAQSRLRVRVPEFWTGKLITQHTREYTVTRRASKDEVFTGAVAQALGPRSARHIRY